jgi:hypothetical protein
MATCSLHSAFLWRFQYRASAATISPPNSGSAGSSRPPLAGMPRIPLLRSRVHAGPQNMASASIGPPKPNQCLQTRSPTDIWESPDMDGSGGDRYHSRRPSHVPGDTMGRSIQSQRVHTLVQGSGSSRRFAGGGIGPSVAEAGMSAVGGSWLRAARCKTAPASRTWGVSNTPGPRQPAGRSIGSRLAALFWAHHERF